MARNEDVTFQVTPWEFPFQACGFLKILRSFKLDRHGNYTPTTFKLDYLFLLNDLRHELSHGCGSIVSA